MGKLSDDVLNMLDLFDKCGVLLYQHCIIDDEELLLLRQSRFDLRNRIKRAKIKEPPGPMPKGVEQFELPLDLEKNDS
jgi:hypothetical protein